MKPVSWLCVGEMKETQSGVANEFMQLTTQVHCPFSRSMERQIRLAFISFSDRMKVFHINRYIIDILNKFKQHCLKEHQID